MTETTKSKLDTLRGTIVMLFGAATIGFLIWAMGIPAAQRLGWIEVETNITSSATAAEAEQVRRDNYSRIFDADAQKRIFGDEAAK